MPELLTSETPLMCSFGEAPGLFRSMHLPGKPVIMDAFATATILEIIPLENIPTFVMCMSILNPEVIAATAAALGVLTPMPCIPVVVDPWEPPALVACYEDIPLATCESKCVCLWGGVIGAVAPVEVLVMEVP
jgi:hypothetical protein